MAKPISFTKRDLEKKKQEKRLAKQQKKEERKSNGTSSFEDMIAYVDENGMITDTPPTPNNKPQEVDMSTIEVSTPRRTEEPIELVHEGRIEHFNVSKGYGFVKDLKNAEKYFFHIGHHKLFQLCPDQKFGKRLCNSYLCKKSRVAE